MQSAFRVVAPFAIHPNVTRTGRDDDRLDGSRRRRCGHDRLAGRRSSGNGGWCVDHKVNDPLVHAGVFEVNDVCAAEVEDGP